MPNIVPIAFVDASMFTAMLMTKYKDRFAADTRRQDTPGSPHHDTETILLRGPEKASAANWFDDVEHIDYPILKEWKSARNLLLRLKAAAAPFLQGRTAELGKVMIVRLKPHGIVDWHVDEGEYAVKHDRAHLCLIPSPGAYLYSGGEVRSLPVGELTYFNNHVPHSAANFGDVPRVHLILDVRKPDPD